MKKLLFLVLLLTLLSSCSDSIPFNYKATKNFEIGRGMSQEYLGNEVYVITVDSIEYLMIDDAEGVAIIKHRDLNKKR